MKLMRQFLLLTLVIALLTLAKVGCIAVNLSGGGSSPAKYKETRTASAPGAPAVVVKSRNGAINVVRGQVAETAITARLAATTQERLDATKVVAAVQSDGALLIEVAWPEGGPKGNEACSFDVVVPASTNAVTANTSNGAIELKNLSGPARLGTSNGRIHVADHGGPVDARTSNGAVTLVRIAGDAEAHTSNGAIEFQDVAGKATAHTSNGKVNIVLGNGAAGPIDVHTSNGAANVTLPASYSGRWALSTSNGSVHYPSGPHIHSVDAGRNHARFTIGDNQTASTVATSNGAIDVRIAN